MQFPSDSLIQELEDNPGLTRLECMRLRPKYLGPLFKLNFHRLILDEAHAIKNFKSQSLFPGIAQQRAQQFRH